VAAMREIVSEGVVLISAVTEGGDYKLLEHKVHLLTVERNKEAAYANSNSIFQTNAYLCTNT